MFFLITLIQPATPLNNHIGKTPAMGWNSWNRFFCDINQDLIKKSTIALSKLSHLGYKYVNIDDCWQLSRDNVTGNIVEDFSKFPDGMAKLVHSYGLLFGLYSSAGTKTCAGRPGSLRYEEEDATTYASWGVDYLKYDNCYNEGREDYNGTYTRFHLLTARYAAMRDALLMTGRPILYSICNWGQAKIWEYGAELGHSWRTTGDITPSWSSVLWILDAQIKITQYSQPGGFNDPDMLEVGNKGLSFEESRSHFSLWAALKSPLLLGNDLEKISTEDLLIITNKEVIDVNQDPLGKSVSFVGNFFFALDFWIGDLENGDLCALVLNRGSNSSTVEVDLSILGIAGNILVRDLWLHDFLYVRNGKFRLFDIPAHGIRMLRISGNTGKIQTTRPIGLITIVETAPKAWWDFLVGNEFLF